MRRTLAKLLILPLVALGVLGLGPGVAGACACGAIIADERLRAVQETALVRFTGDTETVTLNVATRTDATRAAFLMPVPARARFELADAEVFAELDRISRPRVVYREVVVDEDGSDGAAAPGGGERVTVTDHTKVGPFEVAQLAGTDSGAVTDWLAEHDFTLPDDLAGALTPYLAEGWLVVAVRLTPDTSGATFADGLPPMRLTFGTEEPVYPMRLSATAEHAQPLRLYVLADHRMDAGNPAREGGEPELTYANWVRPADLSGHPVLAGMVDGPTFLTRYDATFQPEDITGDIRLTRAVADEPYRAVVIQNRYVTGTSPATIVAWVAVVAGGLVLLLAVLLHRYPRRRP
ncbi:DUF2330 domain-containing protein [Actinophytocola sp.]|uniref:DUF2330 domain-containing protein n=1 Tax=Actinophytocola sp. TaxID=1872138 RepID=UPI003D6C30EB